MVIFQKEKGTDKGGGGVGTGRKVDPEPNTRGNTQTLPHIRGAGGHMFLTLNPNHCPQAQHKSSRDSRGKKKDVMTGCLSRAQNNSPREQRFMTSTGLSRVDGDLGLPRFHSHRSGQTHTGAASPRAGVMAATGPAGSSWKPLITNGASGAALSTFRLGRLTFWAR